MREQQISVHFFILVFKITLSIISVALGVGPLQGLDGLICEPLDILPLISPIELVQFRARIVLVNRLSFPSLRCHLNALDQSWAHRGSWRRVRPIQCTLIGNDRRRFKVGPLQTLRPVSYTEILLQRRCDFLALYLPLPMILLTHA